MCKTEKANNNVTASNNATYFIKNLEAFTDF